MIEIKNFSKSYTGETVYENFNLSLDEGAVTCILGASGSGKTTLLNAIAGLIDYDGSIPKLKCSYIFQTPRLLPNLTVFENLKLVCGDTDKIYAMLEKVRLTDKAGSYPKRLSGGQVQRAAIARAFLYESDVILLDEPFSSLDLKLKNEICELFFGLRKEDKRCALFVTHDADEAAKVANRILVLDKGTVIYDRTLSGETPRGIEQAEGIRKDLLSVLLN